MKIFEELPKLVSAVQFIASEEWPPGVYKLSDYSSTDHPKNDAIVALTFQEPNPYICYLCDGDWIIWDGALKYTMSDAEFSLKFKEVD